ncbi:hypothetical protein WA026_022162 [Henosepilachna vigintioctopunctata]|uniref:Uncharacterized protein n=1 Tax=Henosepilachna vigintioctopunctata TaxID=420089 RepID=A0AAW1TPD2_9CUCU
MLLNVDTLNRNNDNPDQSSPPFGAKRQRRTLHRSSAPSVLRDVMETLQSHKYVPETPPCWTVMLRMLRDCLSSRRPSRDKIGTQPSR